MPTPNERILKRVLLGCTLALVAFLPLGTYAAEPTAATEREVFQLTVEHDALKSSFEDFRSLIGNLFGWAAAIFTVSFGALTWHQTQQRRRELDLLKEQIEKYDKMAAEQDKLTQDLQKASQDSIQQVTQFIRSLDDLFKMVDKAAEIQASVKGMRDEQERVRKEQEQARKEQERTHWQKATDLNRRSREISFTLNRDNYKHGYQQEQIRDHSERLSRWPDKEALSANSRIILGLDYIVRRMFTEAQEELAEATRISDRDALAPDQIDCELLYPNVSRDKVGASATSSLW